MPQYEKIIIYLIEWLDEENRAVGQMARKYIKAQYNVDLPPQKPEEK